MERINREIRDREKVTRNLKKTDSLILKGMEIYHNYVRPHMGLDGKTPADLAGIEVQGENRWLTLIQNASRKREANLSHQGEKSSAAPPRRSNTINDRKSPRPTLSESFGPDSAHPTKIDSEKEEHDP